MRQRIVASVVGPWLVLAVLVPASAEGRSPSHHGSASVSGTSDFNGDGYADLAVGANQEDVGAVGQAGAVNVLYGSAAGLGSVGNQFWTQDSTGVPDQAESGDQFGSAVAGADFNGDGFSDLAIGVPRENYRATDDGLVNVLYGSTAGLTGDSAQLWSQASPGILETPENEDFFGQTLGAGDVNGDGFADLVVGVSYESIGSVEDAGGVNVLYGSAAGLTAVGNQFWSQDSPGVRSQAETSEGFGAAVAAGDLNGDGFDDLAIGTPGQSVSQQVGAGAMSVLLGSASGLTADGNQLWSQASPGVLDQPEGGDGFSIPLATGDLNGDGYADVAIGVPYEDSGTLYYEGAVNVLYGSAAGLTADGNQYWDQDSPGILDQTEAYDYWSYAVAIADFDGDGFGDLAVDSYGENEGAGLVNVLYGSSIGLTADGNQIWSQDSPGVLDKADARDSLGAALRAGDVDGDGFMDLAMGVPSEDWPADSGAVTFLYGSGLGLTSERNQFWTQDSPDIQDQAEALDQFGVSLG